MTKEILRKSEQIIVSNNDLILVVDISIDGAHYDPHLLFYDSTLKLYAGCYFASRKIESIQNGIIFGYLNQERDRRKSGFRNDLPDKYSLHLVQIQEGNSEKKCQKIIEKIIVDSRALNVDLFMRKSQHPYAGYDVLSDSGIGVLNSNFQNQFPVYDTCSYPIEELCFQYTQGILSTSRKDSNDHFIIEEMIVANKQVLDDFYDQLWIIINRGNSAQE